MPTTQNVNDAKRENCRNSEEKLLNPDSSKVLVESDANDDKVGNLSPPSIQLLKPDSTKRYGLRFGKRHVQVLFHGVFYSIASAVSLCMPICLVAMTDPASSINKNITTYEWTQKGTIISANIWGNMLTQTLSGWLSSRYGGKWVLVTSNGLCSISLLLLPTFTYTFEFNGITTTRFVQGLLTGFTGTAIHTILAKWAPLQERSSLATIAGSGLTSGLVIITFASGYMAASWYGWPLVFYVLGSTQLLSSLSFALFGYESPTEHPTISQQELKHITNSSDKNKNNRVSSTPWASIFTSASYLSLVLVQCTYTIGVNVLISQIPIYFNKIMEVDIKSNSILSALPILLMWFLGYVFSFLADWLIVKKIVSITRSRKILISIGFLVPCVGLLMIPQCDKTDITKASILMIIAIGFSDAVLAGHMVNHIDLSPNHAGTLMGIANQFAMMCSASAVLLVQHVQTDEKDTTQWKIIFYSTSASFAFSTLIYNIFGSGKVQPWNEITSDT